jgi:hypothetical protein
LSCSAGVEIRPVPDEGCEGGFCMPATALLEPVAGRMLPDGVAEAAEATPGAGDDAAPAAATVGMRVDAAPERALLAFEVDASAEASVAAAAAASALIVSGLYGRTARS